MTMDRIYTSHQQQQPQHGFQQTQQVHQQQQAQPPLPQISLTQQQQLHQSTQQSQHIYRGNQQQHRQLLLQQQQNHVHQNSSSTISTQPPILHRPIHPPPPPPPPPPNPQASQSQQHPIRSLQHHSQATNHCHLPNTVTLPDNTDFAVSMLRNSLPAVPSRSANFSSELAPRNSLQHNNYYTNTHYQYYQPSNLHTSQASAQAIIDQRHHVPHFHYDQPIQSACAPQQHGPQAGHNITIADSCDTQVDTNGQDHYTEQVIQAILAAKEALEKPIEERDERDILVIDNLCSLVHGYDNFPKSIRRALAAQAVLIVIDEKGKELIVHNEELDSFCVLIFGECEQLNAAKTMPIRYFTVGDAFGVCEPTTETVRFNGHMVTTCENCAFLCVKRDDFYTILTDPANYPSKDIIRHRDRNGNVICVSQFNIGKKSSLPSWSYTQSNPFRVNLPNGHIISKAAEPCLLMALVDGYERLDPEYIEDFLLLFRVFMSYDQLDKEKKLPPGMVKLCLTLADWLDNVDYRDKVVKIVLTWLGSYYHDFELNSEFSYLFFRLLESKLLNSAMNNQLHLLHVTLTTKSKVRHVTISRSSREQPLPFSISGGYEKNCGIFVTQVHGSSSDDNPHENLMSYLDYPIDGLRHVPTVPPRQKSHPQHNPFRPNDKASRISSQLRPGDQILEVNGINFSAIKLVEAQKKLDMSTHLSLTVRFNPSAFSEMRALPEGRRKSSLSSVSSVSPYPTGAQKFTFNLHDQLMSRSHQLDQIPPTSPLFSTNANFGFRSLIRMAPKNDRSRLSHLINTSKQLVRHIRDSTNQSNNLETVSRSSDSNNDDQTNESELGKTKSNPDLPSSKGKDKQLEPGLLNVVRLDDLNPASIAEDSTNGTSNQLLVNVLRVFNAANNDFRYLLVHEQTTAREVVMVAVKEFNLSGNSSSQPSPGEKAVSSLNWHLYEVSVVPESRTIKQKCLSEQTSHLAERASLCSRLYIKNNSSNTIGPSRLDMCDDTLVNEILKESPAHVTLTSLNATLLAVELTLADFDKFRSIEPQQFVYDTFFDCTDKSQPLNNHRSNGSISSHDTSSLKSSSSDGQDTDMLHLINKTRSVPKCWMQEYQRFADISNQEMFWVICEILSERNIDRRVKIVKQFVRVADVCSQLRNYNSMFAIISGLGHSCVSRLKRTFDKLKPKYKNQLDKMRKLFDPSRNMSNYRICLSQTQPPAIPLFPQIKKDLTFTKEGRSIFVREPNDISDDETEFCQDTIRRKTRGDMFSVKSATMDTGNNGSICGDGSNHQLPVAQTRSVSYTSFNVKATSGDTDSLLVNFAEIRQFTERVRNVIYFSSTPYSNDLLTNTKDNQRTQAQIKKMHEEWQMRKRIRHYISQTLDGDHSEMNSQFSMAGSGSKLDQVDGPSEIKQQSTGKVNITYDERSLYQQSLKIEPEINLRPQTTLEPRQIQQPIQVLLPPPTGQLAAPSLVVPLSMQPPLSVTNSSPTLSKSSSLSSCSSFNHHLPNFNAQRGVSNLTSSVGKFGTESTESLRKLRALSENVDDWRSSCSNSSGGNNGLNRITGEGRTVLPKSLVTSRIFPPKTGK